MDKSKVQFISAAVAFEVDQFMFSTGLVSPVLMELAGQAVALCGSKVLQRDRSKKIGIICGPGSKHLLLQIMEAMDSLRPDTSSCWGSETSE